MSEMTPYRFLGKVRFVPTLPKELEKLEELARNVWWTWNPLARSLFRKIDLDTWLKVQGNAVRFLREVSQAKLNEAARDADVVALYKRVIRMFDEYRKNEGTWFQKNLDRLIGEFGQRFDLSSKFSAKDAKNIRVAYFSAEYGLHESLPMYSGGLGALAGDHLKAASDLGIPLVAMGLLYREGYFFQDIDENGNQTAHYRYNRWNNLPITPVQDSDGNDLKIRVAFPGRVVSARIWAVNIGRNKLYLLDCDIAENSPEDRRLTSRLYGGDQETRIQQELILGIGGMRALRALGEKPTIFHMNEGHSAFLSLERLREYMHETNTKDRMSLEEATEIIRSSSVFTTHTPVPAGHDRFPLTMMDKYFRSFYEALPLTHAEFMSFGAEYSPDGQQLFSMTLLAIHFASMVNGVSQLHGDVTKKMMHMVWRDLPPQEIPVDAITNGVHTHTWMSFDMQELFDRHLPEYWRDRVMEPEMWSEALDNIPDAELWETLQEMKKSMVNFIHNRLKTQHERFGELPDALRRLDEVISEDRLTIAFARRFATYKRATLIFRDIPRLKKLITDPERPVQLIFAGKAHPADQPGQALIRHIIEISKDPDFHNRLVFVENYDMNGGRRLTSGADVWLNTPRRPMEASGTSGMKGALNGTLNFSVLDGWWPEAYNQNPDTGWKIGQEREYETDDQQDQADAEDLYRTLENEIIPLYFERDQNGIPVNWLKRVREGIKVIAPQFNAHRMVRQYAENYYVHGSIRHHEFFRDAHQVAKDFAQWKEDLRKNWSSIRISANVAAPETQETTELQTVQVNDKIEIQAEVELGSIKPDWIKMQIFVETLNGQGADEFPKVDIHPMEYKGRNELGRHLFTGLINEPETGEYGYTVRAIPQDNRLYTEHEIGLVRWAQV